MWPWLGRGRAMGRWATLAALTTVAALLLVLSQPRLIPRLIPRLTPRLAEEDPYETAEAGDEKFVVATQHCHIPDVDPFDESVRPFLRPEPPIVCSRRPPLSYIAQLKDGGHELRVDPSSDPVAPEQDLWCCYSNVTRGANASASASASKAANHTATGANTTASPSLVDSQFREGPCVPFKGLSARLLPEEEFIVVRCAAAITADPDAPRRDIYTHMHALVPTAKASAARAAAEARTSPTPREDARGERLSVLLVGVDSMSHLSLHRTMPRTLKALQRLGFVGLRGYNKVGDNTLPNLAAALAGLTMEQMRERCTCNDTAPLDLCPFVWKDFARRGYVTAYLEDTPAISTFRRGGFIAPPTDFYLRPYMLAAEALLARKRRGGLSVCLGSISTTDHVLSYAEAFLDAMRGFPFFAHIWLNNFSHNDHNTPAAMDVRFLRFFDDLAASTVLNESMVVFFSDHGIRFGDIRNTFVGWLEERLPFFFVALPEWFRQKYPEAQTNLETNAIRLTSPFDIYATLAGLATGDTVPWGATQVPGCPACHSLLAGPLPDRTCAEAGIAPHWCTCAAHDRPLPANSPTAWRAAEVALRAVSARLDSAPPGRCATLALQRVLAARSARRAEGEGDDVLVVFKTEPGAAHFEATVRHSKPDTSPFVLGTVSRINSYATQSSCVADADLKLYCFCIS